MANNSAKMENIVGTLVKDDSHLHFNFLYTIVFTIVNLHNILLIFLMCLWNVIIELWERSQILDAILEVCNFSWQVNENCVYRACNHCICYSVFVISLGRSMKIVFTEPVTTVYAIRCSGHNYASESPRCKNITKIAWSRNW